MTISFAIIDGRDADAAALEATSAALEATGISRERQFLVGEDVPATGDFLMVDAGVTPDVDAAQTLGATLIESGSQLAYADSRTPAGEVDRPDWSRHRIYNHWYLGGCVAVSGTLREDERTGIFREGNLYTFALSLAETNRPVAHVRRPLFSEPVGVSEVIHGRLRRQLGLHLARTRPQIAAVDAGTSGVFRLNRHSPVGTRISIVIPTRGTSGVVFGRDQVFVVEAVRSVLSQHRGGDLEFVIVYDSVTPLEVMEELRRLVGPNLVEVEYTSPFNFSEKCNLGFLASTGEIIVMLNDDVRASSPDFIEQLAAPLEDHRIGLTGAFLCFEDGTIQHVGHWYAGPSPRHAMITQGANQPGPGNALLVEREVSGLTAACIAMRRDTFIRVGGFSEALPSNYNDVDFSLKVRSVGLDLLWIPHVRAHHFESKTREGTVHEWERQILRARWGIPEYDPFWPHAS